MWRPLPHLPLPYLLNVLFSSLCFVILNSQVLDLFSIIIFVLLGFSYFSLQGSSPGYVSTTTSSRSADNSELSHSFESIQHEYDIIDDVISERDVLFIAGRERKRGSYCEVCKLSVPLRAYHCRECGRCVHMLDHHCPFINTCIGERNHFRFILFLFVHLIAIIISLLNIQKSIVTSTIILTRSIRIFRVIAEVYFVILSLFTGLLLVFHLFLMVTNSRTFELMAHREQREEADPCDFPHSRGPIYNSIQLIRSDGIFSGLSSDVWKPVEWKEPKVFNRDDVTVCANPLNNKYYSCC